MSEGIPQSLRDVVLDILRNVAEDAPKIELSARVPQVEVDLALIEYSLHQIEGPSPRQTNLMVRLHL